MDSAFQSVFPLPVVDFELYHILDDSPEYPGVFPFEVRLRGAMNRDAFAAAWRASLQRHPLLSARLSGHLRNASWIAGTSPELHWSEEPETGYLESPALDLRHEPPLRAHIYAHGDLYSLRMLFHHACCDAVGAFQFIEDLLLAYDHCDRQRSGHPPWRALNATRLRVRGELGLRGYGGKLIDFYNTAAIWFALMFRHATIVRRGVATGTASGVVRHSPWLFSEAWFSRERSDGLRQAAQRSGVTLNDLMLRDLCLAIADWNGGPSQRWIRITVPKNLRVKEDSAMPAANVVGFAFLEHRLGRDHDAKQLLLSIHEQMAAVKRWRLGLAYNAGLRMVCRFPRLTRWVLGRDLTFATASLSNLGTPLRESPLVHDDRIVCGGATVEAIVCVPPVRRNTHISIATMIHCGQLVVMLIADATRFTREHRESFLEAFVNRLVNSKGKG
jgi:hypothetical protein